jgi:lipid-A-disaccharide synthase
VARNGNTRIMLVAGEASGDLHGGHLAESLKTLRPDLELFGIGGLNMRKAGVSTLVDISTLAVVGIWEVLAHFKEIKGAFDRMRDIIVSDPPDMIVLIDYPDFNLRLAKVAKKAGVPVVYYISPQVWAWRRGRVKKIAGLVRKMLVVFPFEKEFYDGAGVDCVFVGHPVLDEQPETRDRKELSTAFGLDHARPVLGLLPGSRKKEVSFHLPVMVEAYKRMKASMPELQAVIPVADTLDMESFGPYISGIEDVKLVSGDTNGVMTLMDCAVVASGTATLQVGLHNKPMVIMYRLSPLTYRIGRLLIKVKYIGLVNLVLGGPVVPELIQDEATPENISSFVSRTFTDERYRQEMIEKLKDIKSKLGGSGASMRAAQEIVRSLG